jgi:hypothetical protein
LQLATCITEKAPFNGAFLLPKEDQAKDQIKQSTKTIT